MKISLIHPSRHRIKQALATREKWLLRADGTVEYIFSFDSDDDTIPAWVDGLRLPNKTAIEAINNAATICTGDIIVVVSDDTGCPEHWDTLLLKELEGKSDFVLKVWDGIQKVCVTMPVIDRVWYERYGYIYHPDYLHMACDVHLTAVAIMTGRLLYSDLLFEHLHYSTLKTERDHINEKNDLTYEHGDAVLTRHKEVNFGILEPICSYDEIVWHPE